MGRQSIWNDPLLRSLQSMAFGMMVMPAQRFFIPTERFFSLMERFKGRRIIDVGTGSGDVPHELRERGHTAIGLDPVERDKRVHQVSAIDGRDFPYDCDDVVLLCRPSHEGWAQDVLEIALAAGATVIYVGLSRNLQVDLGKWAHGYAEPSVQRVGDEGESARVFTSLQKRSRR